MKTAEFTAETTSSTSTATSSTTAPSTSLSLRLSDTKIPPSCNGSCATKPVEMTALSEAQQWQQMLESAVRAVVSIRFSRVAAFDTDYTSYGQATGFIVDIERGLILTNRHVASAGPFVGEAVFNNHEVLDVFPIYRDPIHDFGFLKFDPAKIRHLKMTSITLAPEKAKVGLDIRVLGNDAGQKLSILSGSISRLDRNAPNYGKVTYNDFNTFYLQAASSTSGGSSGSPVLDIHGDAVALQAGGSRDSATDFFLPLNRVRRALKCIQEGQSVARGTIQAHFLHRPFEESKHLGLSQETEDLIRGHFPEEVGMLVAENVLPKGPASVGLEDGDILISINGELMTRFVPLDDLLDSSVGQEIEIVAERAGERRQFKTTVQDLHSITPDRYVELGDAIVNQISYQLARSFCIPVEGIYVARAYGMFRCDGGGYGWMITTINHQPVPTLEDFIRVVRTIPDRERVPIVFYNLTDIHTTKVSVVQAQWHWTPFRLAVRNDTTGVWDFTDLEAPMIPKPIIPATVRLLEKDLSLGLARELFKSLVRVEFYIPVPIDGTPITKIYGTGLVVDAERGLVIASRRLIPFAMGDVTITVGDSAVIPAKITFLHPTHNFAVLTYNPAHLGYTAIQSAKISPVKLAQGHDVTLVAFDDYEESVCLQTVVTQVVSTTISRGGCLPRYRSINYESISLGAHNADQCPSGVLADKEGRVQGLWLSYSGHYDESGDYTYRSGLGISAILPVLEPMRKGIYPKLRRLCLELSTVTMSKARTMGLSQAWVQKIEEANPARQQVFMIQQTEFGSGAALMLQKLDLVLSLDGHVLTTMDELDTLVREDTMQVEMVVLRNNVELTLTVPTNAVDGKGTKRILYWAGSVVQEPHQAVRQMAKSMPSQVYISSYATGSPANAYSLPAAVWITQINGVETPDLDAFLKAVRKCPDNAYVRVKIIALDLVPTVISVKMNYHYWPTVERVQDESAECGWRVVPESEQPSAPSPIQNDQPALAKSSEMGISLETLVIEAKED